MRKFELRFTTFWNLAEFYYLLTSRATKTSFKKQTIVCSCTEAEIELAKEVFKAEIRPLE